MSVDVFIDTNVFIYHIDRSDRRKRAIAERVVHDALLSGNACISFQVIQEWLNTVLKKATVRLEVDAARAYLDTVLAPLLRVSASVPLYHRALDIHERFRLSPYDSLIVSAALAAGCNRLLSEDLQDGQRIESLVISNPFAT
jgi:predicted nucleic acid-binding protein